MPTVYVTQRPQRSKAGWKPNLLPATVYGELKYVFESDDYVFSSPNESMAKAKEILNQFDPSVDYILYPNTGDPAAIYAICLILGYWFSQCTINFLYWDRTIDEDGNRSHDKGSYKVIPMPLHN